MDCQTVEFRNLSGQKILFPFSRLTEKSRLPIFSTPNKHCKFIYNMKRQRLESLTGGTGDVNPQYLSGSVTLSAANTATETVISAPIVRVGPATKDTAIIMELIKLYVDFPPVDTTAATATAYSVILSFSSQSQGATPTPTVLSNPQCLARLEHDTRFAFTAAGTGNLNEQVVPVVWDFTDGDGHGILYASDNLYFQGLTGNFNAAVTITFKLLYRFKRVSLVEYIGLVQSQS